MADYSLLFDGDNDKVSIADSNSWDPGAVMTIECWINCTANNTHAAQTYLKKDNEYIFRMDLTKPRFICWTEGGVITSDSGTVLTINTWHHVAGVYDGTYVDFYLDGVRKAHQAGGSGNVSTSGDGVTIGIGAPDEGFPGYIDEMRVSKSVRYTGATITVPTTKFVSDANTIALYHFDEGTGTVLVDSGPNGLNQALADAPATPTWSSTTAGLADPSTATTSTIRRSLSGIQNIVSL